MPVEPDNMPATSRLFLDLGFQVWHIPGVSRAWKREYSDGSFLLITDAGGYDLPEPTGPWSGIYLSHRDEFLELAPLARRMKEIIRWIRHTERLCLHRGAALQASDPPRCSNKCPMDRS